MTSAELDRLLEILPGLAAPAIAAGGYIADFQRGLFEGEEKFVFSAVKKRRAEFEAGRCAARIALEKFGIAECPIPQGGNGEPLWPVEIAGSITHSDSLCFAACAKKRDLRAVGIDAERVGRMVRRLWRMTFSEDEQDAIRKMPDEAVAATVAFSAKEAFEKAQFAVSGRVMGFRSMRVKFAGSNELFVTKIAEDDTFADVPRECRLRYTAIGDHAVVFCAFPSIL